MADHLRYALLLLVVLAIDKCVGRGRFTSSSPNRWIRPVPKQSQASSMPNSMVLSMRKLTSTDDFLQNMHMYQEEKNKGNLPSQMNVGKLKSRSSGGAKLQTGWVNLDIQPCIVRPTIHFLEQPHQSENALIWPHAVQLPRCVGSCMVRHDVVECRGETWVDIPLTMYRVPYHKSRKRRDVMEELSKIKDPVHELTKRSAHGGVQVITTKLQAHTTCHCACVATTKICAMQRKVLNKASCQCECSAVKKCTFPYKWDTNQCKCVCGEDRSNGMALCRKMGPRAYWVHPQCSCKCLHCDTKYNNLDPKTCHCSCLKNPPACPTNKKLIRNDPGPCYCRTVKG